MVFFSDAAVRFYSCLPRSGSHLDDLRLIIKKMASTARKKLFFIVKIFNYGRFFLRLGSLDAESLIGSLIRFACVCSKCRPFPKIAPPRIIILLRPKWIDGMDDKNFFMIFYQNLWCSFYFMRLTVIFGRKWATGDSKLKVNVSKSNYFSWDWIFRSKRIIYSQPFFSLSWKISLQGNEITCAEHTL